ncbi:MAG: cyclic nucleotide-binding domain-containing protein [Verrucomicrobia bacterium]|nr:cyclic nucleotide-binding domain-containing protein [Verrucomicrobiota bacterium]
MQACVDDLFQIPLFENIERSDLDVIVGHLGCRKLKPEEVLFKEGDPGDYMAFMIDGSVDVLQENASGKSVIINQVSKGRSLGEMSLIDRTARSATVRARTEATVIILTREGFARLMEDRPRVALVILMAVCRMLSQHLRKQSSRVADLL